MKKFTQYETPAELFALYIKCNFKTQRAAADHFGITQASISQVVNGKRSPSAAMLEAAGIK